MMTRAAAAVRGAGAWLHRQAGAGPPQVIDMAVPGQRRDLQFPNNLERQRNELFGYAAALLSRAGTSLPRHAEAIIKLFRESAIAVNSWAVLKTVRDGSLPTLEPRAALLSSGGGVATRPADPSRSMGAESSSVTPSTEATAKESLAKALDALQITHGALMKSESSKVQLESRLQKTESALAWTEAELQTERERLADALYALSDALQERAAPAFPCTPSGRAAFREEHIALKIHCAKLKRTAELEVKGLGFVGDWSEWVVDSGRFRTGKVRVTGQRGRGGQGGVFGLEAVDAAKQRRILEVTGQRGVVVKTASKDPTEGELEGLKNELRCFARLPAEGHRCLIDAYSLSSKRWTLVMPSMDMSLKDLLAGRDSKLGQLSDQQMIKLGQDCALGLGFLHSHELVHCDVKPDNMMVNFLPSGEVHLKLVDLGHAGPSGTRNTGTTLDTSCPEVLHLWAQDGVQRERPRRCASQDVYSAGLVVQMLLSRTDVPMTDPTVLESHDVAPSAAKADLLAMQGRRNELLRDCLANPADRDVLDNYRAHQEWVRNALTLTAGMEVKTKDADDFILARHVWTAREDFEHPDEIAVMLRIALHRDPERRMTARQLAVMLSPTDSLFDRKGPGARPLGQEALAGIKGLGEDLRWDPAIPPWIAEAGRWWERTPPRPIAQQ